MFRTDEIVAYFILYYSNGEWQVSPPLDDKNEVDLHYQVLKNVIQVDYLKILKITE